MTTLSAKVRNHRCNDDCGLQPVDQWFCLTRLGWTHCPGPCPDGTPHDGPKVREVLTHVIR